jgi:K+-transporting ATPase ATPase C chain
MKDIITTMRLVVLSIIICGFIYPALVLGVGQVLLPWQADGRMIIDSRGRTVGSAAIAQRFTRPDYFWPRPSAVAYAADAAGGSNLSPANPALGQRAAAEIQRYDLKADQRVPADLVAASGSGLDPHITLEAAWLQLPRVAAARGMSEAQVQAIIESSSERHVPAMFGGRLLVNVLRLNLALDKLAAGAGQ